MPREYLFDNAKVILITFVVFGHLIEGLIDNSFFKTIYLIIYSFHMPAFVLISGSLARKEINILSFSKDINKTLIPFLSFTFLYELLYFILNGEVSSYLLELKPHWVLWYLLSLFCWKILLPILMLFKYPIIISICLSALAGYVDSIGTNSALSLSRTIYFLPFFIIGYKLKPFLLNNAGNSKYKILLISVIFTFSFVLFLNHDLNQKWFYGSYSYNFFGESSWKSGFIRIALFLFSLIMSLSFLLLVTQNRKGISILAQKTIYIYMIHGLFIMILKANGLFIVLATYHPLISLSILLTITTAFIFLLSRNFIAEQTNKIMIKPACILLLKD